MCQFKPFIMDDETWIKEKVLGPFEEFFFQENYNKGEPNTEIEIRSEQKKPMLMILNQRDGQSSDYFSEEMNKKESQISFLKTWGNNKESKSVEVTKSDLFMTLVNLDQGPVSIKVTVSSKN